jgi:hypothetical protein
VGSPRRTPYPPPRVRVAASKIICDFGIGQGGGRNGGNDIPPPVRPARHSRRRPMSGTVFRSGRGSLRARLDVGGLRSVDAPPSGPRFEDGEEMAPLRRTCPTALGARAALPARYSRRRSAGGIIGRPRCDRPTVYVTPTSLRSWPAGRPVRRPERCSPDDG